MKQLVIVSGKGGTGKTTVTASLFSLAKNAVAVDADVDAANLYLLLDPEVQQREPFISGQEASIDLQRCVQCGICRDLCRFEAIGEDFRISSLHCEGCGVCAAHCPEQAVTLSPRLCGEWFRSETKAGPFIHGKLGIAAENSGKMVALLREQARNLAEERKLDLVVIDGPPGIGCPVISSLTGVDMALAVTEPTPSGLHDLKRLAQLTKHFGIALRVFINKVDLSPKMVAEVEAFCRDEGIKVVGRLPLSNVVMRANVAQVPLVDYSSGAASLELRRLWDGLRQELELPG